MAYLFDTNVISELRRSDRLDPQVFAFLDGIPAAESFVSVISLMEIEIGIRLKERKDPQQGAGLRRWFEKVRRSYEPRRALGIDLDIAMRCASLHVPDRRGAYDALIAATAIKHGLTVATRNSSHFQDLDCPVINPWEIGEINERS